MRRQSILSMVMLVVFAMAADASATTAFSDDFENDTTGSFPSQWANYGSNPDVIVVDEATDPGAIYDGDKSVRITFNGGQGSGIKTTFDSVACGVVTFFCRVEWASDDLQLMGLHNFADTERPDSHLITVSINKNIDLWEYSVSGSFIGVPVVFGEYDRIDLHFDTELDTATLYINNVITSIVNFPFENPSDGLTTLRSIDDSGPGTAQWYLDNVTVTTKPPAMVFIPGGEFEYGGITVTMDSFYMSKYEITNQQYCDYLNSAILVSEIKVDDGIVYDFNDTGNTYPYCNTHGYGYDAVGQIDYNDNSFNVRTKNSVDMKDHPMIEVSWYGAAAYCNWRSQQEGKEACYNLSTWESDFGKYGYRLPNEAEWEYAARGGEHDPYYSYPWGNSLDGSKANYKNSNDPYETGDYPWTTPVGYYDGGQIPAGTDMVNGYGLYDMIGNVWEWCNDWYSGNYRNLRGGCWGCSTYNCRIALRTGNYPYIRAHTIGFRIVRPYEIFLLGLNGGEVLTSGKAYPIKWSSAGTINNVLIEYSTDNGSSWTEVNPPNVGNSGIYNWLVPAVDSNQCLVRVSDANDPNINDMSDDVFTIETIIGGYINWIDLFVFMNRWLEDGCSDVNEWCGRVDINRDTEVDSVDYSWLAKYWLGIAPEPNSAGNPEPNDTATEVSITADLSWTAGADAAAHGVYFGTNPTPDVNEFWGYQTEPIFNPGTMAADTTYYWQVNEVGLGGETAGDVWSFTTCPVPGKAYNPSPSDSATNISINANLSWTANFYTTSHDVYFGTNPTPGAGEFKGNQASTTFELGTLDYETIYFWRIDGVGPGGTTTGIVWSFTTEAPPVPGQATNPAPADTATDVNITACLNWTAGANTTSHDVYFGTISPGDLQGNQTETTFCPPNSLGYNTTYYWRIDEKNPYNTTIGEVWSFTTEASPVPGQATNPSPIDVATDVDLSTCLGWSAGANTTSHDVYFGTISPGDFQGNQTETTFCPPNSLEYNTTYYWRVDEKNPYNTTTGEVWSFTTMHDPNLAGWWKFNEASGVIAYDSSGRENHGQLVDGLGNGLVWAPAEGALNFDGSNNLSRVVIPTIGMSTTAGTITIWANLAEPQNRGDGRNGSGYFFGCDNGVKDRILLYMDNSNTDLDVRIGDHTESNIITLGTLVWYHITLTWNGGNYAVYLNGSEIATGAYGGLTSLPSTADIGNNDGSSKQSFHGLMGDVQVYDRNLSVTEIQQLYQDVAN